MNKIIIFCDKSSNRLSYTLEVIFKHVLNIDYSILYEYDPKKNIHINYSALKIDNCIQIIPYTLLFENKLVEQNISVDWINEIPLFFKTSSKNKINHDFFACVFYMVSRYEEYLSKDLDIHGRFKAENSLAYKNNFLEKPVVNLWIAELQKLLQKSFPSLNFPKKKYSYTNSVDIDVAYSYKGKSKSVLASSLLKNFLQGNTQEIKNKFEYATKQTKDPYDTYKIFNQTNNHSKLFFIQVGNYGAYDKNLNHHSTEFQNLIKKLQKTNDIGLHPSYQSNVKSKFLAIEKKRLENILEKKITKSRQHFLKLSFPETYENLLCQGIEHDYTLGFASKVGFRAGICNSFPFFNLKTNELTKLMLHPFQIMDGTLNTYMKLTPEQAITKSKEIINSIKAVQGTFVSLWHNSSLSEQNEWKDWKLVYTKLVEFAQED